MSADANLCIQLPQVAAYVTGTLPGAEVTALHQHLTTCAACRDELLALQRVAESLAFWPSDDVRAPASLQQRLARRLAEETGSPAVPVPAPGWVEPAWEEVAPGIFCKLLATDTDAHRVSMLVQLLPGVEYPPHQHAGIEELFLLDGELWIDDRRLYAGDYNRAEIGTGDKRVWSGTGCTCVLITSTQDVLGA